MARFLVNHGGVVHMVNDEELALHLGQASVPPTREDPRGKPAREASAEEILSFCAAHGITPPEELSAAVAVPAPEKRGK